jgi:hypothetical protein
MSYEENIQNYKDSISNILSDQLASSAQRIAEGGELGEEARQATAQIVGPLALDMLKEGIMHKAGVASAKIGAGKNVRDQINDAFKAKFKQLSDRATDAAKAKGQELLEQGRGKLQDVVDQARGKATAAVQEGQDALTSAVGTARQAAQATGDRLASQARGALEQGANVRDLATSAVQDGVAQVRGAQGGFTSGRAPAAVPPQNNDDKIVAQGARANDPQQVAQDTLDRYKGHVDEKVADLRSKLTDPSQKVVIAGKEGEGTNIGSERAVGQWQTFANEQGMPNVGPQVRQYTNDQLNQLKTDFPDQVRFGRIKPSDQIPDDEIHVWGANTANANIPNGEVFPAAVSGGQAAVIGKGSPNEMGIVSTPLTGVPDVKPSGAPQVASTSGQAPALRYDPRASRRANFSERLNALSDEDKASVKADYNAGKTAVQPNETPEQRSARIQGNNKLTDDLVTAKENANSASEANNPTSNQVRDSLAPMREAMAQTQSQKPVTQQDVPSGAGGANRAETNIDNLGSRPSTLDASKFTVAPQDEPKTSAPAPTEEAPSFFSTANIAERSGDALGAAAAGIGAAYAISRPGLTAGQRATTAVEAAAPLVAEKAIGDVIPGAGLLVSGIEDAATPNLGSASQRAEDFGVQTGVLAAQKVGFKAGQALQRTIQARRAGQAASEGEEGTELTDFSTVGGEAGETAAGATAETAAGTAAGTETAAATGGVAAELGTDAAAAAATGPESGGLGFIAAGVIGLGAVLASIFSPHHHEAPKTGPAPNLAIPVQSVGLR